MSFVKNIRPNLYELISMRAFDIKQTAFFWCDHSQKIKKIKSLLGNRFMSDKTKEEFMVNFSRFQRTLNTFKRSVRLWRIKKKYLIYQNTTDLKGVELSEYKPHLVIDLIENNTVYSFYIHDLLKMWNIALGQRMYIIESPIPLKNPYTNVEISRTNLFNIYFKALLNGIRRPPRVDMHYQCCFSMKLMLSSYGTQLREWAITDYAQTEDLCLYHELTGIKLDYGNLLPQLKINDSFSEKFKMHQIKTYKPIIQAFCFMSYSSNSHLISRFTTLFYKLIDSYNR
jgi:hypothetical protein